MVPGFSVFVRRSELANPLKLAVSMLVVVIITRAAAVATNRFDELFPGASLVSQALLLALGLGITSQFILRRAALRARWGEHAYSVGFRWIVMPGLTLVTVAFAHLAWIEDGPLLPQELTLLPSAYLLVTGSVLWLRALMVFGLDNATLIYVMYPEHARLVQSDIYSVLRHPIYSGVLRFAAVIALWNGSALAVVGAAITAAAMLLTVRLVEERELIERFGESYRAYRRRVPAFVNLDPRAWPVLWRFMLLGH